MRKIIIIRYSEIFLKGNNKGFFEKLLINNIKNSLKSFQYTFVNARSRYLLTDIMEENSEEIMQTVLNVFGVHSASFAYEVSTSLDNIAEAAKLVCSKEGTFKVSTNRADKKFELKSTEVSAEIGYQLLTEFSNLKVDVIKPESIVHIDIRENGKTYVFSKIITAIGGMPVGCGGKGLVLLSGGIDSPVAAFMMARRGMTLRALHFHSYPYTSTQAKDKVLALASILKKYCIELKVDTVSFTQIQTAIHDNCPPELQITIMRRFMMKIAEIVAIKNKCGAIITGESLGQVASQTLESIITSNAVVSMPVLRPLIGFDKQDIIEVAVKIDTLKTSIQPFEDCCTVFLPKNPATKPRESFVIKAEENLDMDTLIKNALDTLQTEVF